MVRNKTVYTPLLEDTVFEANLFEAEEGADRRNEDAPKEAEPCNPGCMNFDRRV